MKKVLDSTFAVGAVLCLTAVGFFALSVNFPGDSKLFPQIFATLLFFLSVVMCVQQVRKNLKTGAPERFFTALELRSTAIGYVLMIVYVALITKIGFYVSTTMFLLAMMFYLGIRSWKVLIGVTVGTDVFVYLLFGRLLMISFPSGLFL